VSGDIGPEREYIRKRNIRYIYMVLLLLVGIGIGTYSCGIGGGVFDFADAMEAIRDRLSGVVYNRRDNYWKWLIDGLVFEGTLPRAMGGLLVGAILGVCGAVMQMCVRNPLASPYTTGISSAALFGVTLYLVWGFAFIPLGGEFKLMINAFVFSLVPCFLMILLSMKTKTTPTMLVLIGIGIMYLFNAFTMMMKYRAEPDVLRQIQLWSVGTLTGMYWTCIWILIATLIILVALIYVMSRKLDLLSAGDNFAQSLGTNPNKVRLTCMLIISMATAVAVCYAGSIGFVGLIVPHISRIIVGSKSNMLIPCSAAVGAVLLMGADTASRLLGIGLPVGAVTALIGAPIFLYILIKMRTSGWGR